MSQEAGPGPVESPSSMGACSQIFAKRPFRNHVNRVQNNLRG